MKSKGGHSMVHEDVVNCEYCGSEITHIVCGIGVTEDENYRTCDACLEEQEERL